LQQRLAVCGSLNEWNLPLADIYEIRTEFFTQRPQNAGICTLMAYLHYLTDEFAIGPVTIQNWIVITGAIFALWILALRKRF
jgi:hypothetical protein